MAVIWRKTKAGVDYQVRAAGATRRLYTNGVFHSQFNSLRPVGGSVWDLLLLPAFFHSATTLKRVLVLGVGGGAVIRQLQHFFPSVQIIGVELNPVHLQVAQRFFGVNGESVELIQADAIGWLKSYRGPKFDLIIDDLFGDTDGEPQRVVAADSRWLQTLLKALSRTGTLVINFDTVEGLQSCAAISNADIAEQFFQAWCFSTPLYENNIGVFTRQQTSRAMFLQHLQRHRELDGRFKGCRLNAKWQQLR